MTNDDLLRIHKELGNIQAGLHTQQSKLDELRGYVQNLLCADAEAILQEHFKNGYFFESVMTMDWSVYDQVSPFNTSIGGNISQLIMDIGDIFGIEFGQTNPETKQAEVIFPIRSPYRYDKVYDLDTVMLHIRTGSEHKKFTLRVKGLDYPVSYNPDGGGYFFLHNGKAMFFETALEFQQYTLTLG